MKNPLLVVLLLATGCFQLTTAQDDVIGRLDYIYHHPADAFTNSLIMGGDGAYTKGASGGSETNGKNSMGDVRKGDAGCSRPGDPTCGWGFLGAVLNSLRGMSPSPDSAAAASGASQHAAEIKALQDEEEFQARANRRGNWKASAMWFCIAVGLSIFLWAIGGCTDKRASGVRQPLIVRMNAWADLESPITVPSDRLASVTYTLLHDSSGVAAGQAFMQKYPTFKVSQDNKCTVCFDRAIDVVLDPCGHIIACGLCAQSLNPQRCPVCREDIQQILSAKGGDSHNGTSLEQPRVEAAS